MTVPPKPRKLEEYLPEAVDRGRSEQNGRGFAEIVELFDGIDEYGKPYTDVYISKLFNTNRMKIARWRKAYGNWKNG